MDSCLYRFLCWLAQLLTWFFLIIVLISKFGNNIIVDKDNTYLYIFIGVYVCYAGLEFYSQTLRYIKNKGSDQFMYQKMGVYFRTYPEINFYCECYHYTRVRRKKGSSRRKVITHTEHYSLPYYSERDVSGLFYLDIDRANANSKQYIQLDLFPEINFADAISYMDYEYEKDLFWRRNRFRDKRFYFQESRIIPGMEMNNLVKLSEDEPCCVNMCIYIFMTLLTLCEFYKLYFNSLCIYQVYRVRKIVSTRYDLNQPIYQCFVPQLNLFSKQYNYNPEDYNFINNNYKVQVPTKQELNMAKKYQDKIPDYKISSGNGQFHAGVIIDNPGYSSYSANEPPAAFAGMGNDVEIEDNQINEDGQVPQGFCSANTQVNQNNANVNYDVSNIQFQQNNGYINNAFVPNNGQIHPINNKNNNKEQISSTKRQIFSKKRRASKGKNTKVKNNKIKK